MKLRCIYARAFSDYFKYTRVYKEVASLYFSLLECRNKWAFIYLGKISIDRKRGGKIDDRSSFVTLNALGAHLVLALVAIIPCQHKCYTIDLLFCDHIINGNYF